MFVYCIVPDGVLRCNFIKIGFSTNPECLNKRYNTYYGSDSKIYYVNVKGKKVEKNIHEKLKIMGLHLKNELFIYNEKFNFNFYCQILNNYEDIYNSRKEHILNFFIFISNENTNKIYSIKKDTNKWKYYEESEYFIFYNRYNIEKYWTYYLLFCSRQIKQYYNKKEKFKKYIKTLNIEFIQYKDYIFEITRNYIKVMMIKEIDFKEYVLKKYNLIINMKEIIKNFLNNLNEVNETIILNQIILKFINSSYTKNIDEYNEKRQILCEYNKKGCYNENCEYKHLNNNFNLFNFLKYR